MKTRWNVREILSQNTDTLGLVMGFVVFGILITLTVVAIVIR